MSSRRLRKARGAGVAALLFVIALVVYFDTAPVAVSGIVPITLPAHFWTILLLIIALGLVAHVFRLERYLEKARRGLAARPNPPEEPELRPHGLVAPRRVDPDDVAGPGTSRGAAAASLPQLLDWIEGVGTRISEWTSSVGGSRSRKQSDAEELADESPGHSTKTRLPRIGGWTEIRARMEIARYLRGHPWAHGNDIAKALGMDVGLATRVADGLREEAVR